jgi:hypothetical protein
MLGEPAIQDWELFVRSDLAPHLVPPCQPPCIQRPAVVSMIPGGGLEALTRCVGRCDLEDVLLVSASARPTGPWSRRCCLYAPLCVLGIGECGLALWVQALPSPDVRIVLVFGEIGMIEQSVCDPWRELTVTGQDGKLSLRYDARGDTAVDTWLPRLRTRCVGRPQPLPDEPRVGQQSRFPSRWRLPLDYTEDADIASRRLLPWPGSCLLAVTSREVVISGSRRAWPRPWRANGRTAWLPRCSVTGARVRSRSLLLRSSGVGVRLRLPSRAAAVVASRWLDGSRREEPVHRRSRQRDHQDPGTAHAGESQ